MGAGGVTSRGLRVGCSCSLPAVTGGAADRGRGYWPVTAGPASGDGRGVWQVTGGRASFGRMERPRSHYLPRTPMGRVIAALFLGVFAFTQPPLVYVLANRTEPSIGGVPFLYVYLLVLYFLLIAILIWAARRKL